MRTTVFSALAIVALLFTACGGGRSEQPAAPYYSDMLGLWVLQQPDGAAKLELMFNEDSTGFVFVADTFHCGISWQPNSAVINAEYHYRMQGMKFSIPRRFDYSVSCDTLFLREFAEDGSLSPVSRFVRFKQ